ncbi:MULTISPECIES: NprX family peptide pheromone [unclassified Bacillus cereus group]|nr:MULTISPECIES: NprX family peptide pheromone [unclassified Bacillus cereus group]
MKKVIFGGIVLVALLIAVLEPQYGWRPDMSAGEVNTVEIVEA